MYTYVHTYVYLEVLNLPRGITYAIFELATLITTRTRTYVRAGRDARGAIGGRKDAKIVILLLEFDTPPVRVARRTIYHWNGLNEKHLLSTKKHSNSQK